MTEVEIKSLLDTFKKSAAELNSASNDINSIIKSYEAQLVAANAGLEYWEPELRLAERIRFKDDDYEKKYTVPQLGFAKVQDAWRLVVRNLVITEGFSDNEPTYDEDPELYSEKPLSDAPRTYRIAALAQFPEFLRGLNREVEKALETIDRAKRLVE